MIVQTCHGIIVGWALSAGQVFKRRLDCRRRYIGLCCQKRGSLFLVFFKDKAIGAEGGQGICFVQAPELVT